MRNLFLTVLYKRSSFCLSFVKMGRGGVNKNFPLEAQLQKSNIASSGNSHARPLSFLLNYRYARMLFMQETLVASQGL